MIWWTIPNRNGPSSTEIIVLTFRYFDNGIDRVYTDDEVMAKGIAIIPDKILEILEVSESACHVFKGHFCDHLSFMIPREIT